MTYGTDIYICICLHLDSFDCNTCFRAVTVVSVANRMVPMVLSIPPKIRRIVSAVVPEIRRCVAEVTNVTTFTASHATVGLSKPPT